MIEEDRGVLATASSGNGVVAFEESVQQLIERKDGRVVVNGNGFCVVAKACISAYSLVTRIGLGATAEAHSSLVNPGEGRYGRLGVPESAECNGRGLKPLRWCVRSETCYLCGLVLKQREWVQAGDVDS